MFATKTVISVMTLFVYFCHQQVVQAVSLNKPSATADELNTCEEQLSKYRKFLLQAIVSFEDVCDAYNARPLNTADVAYRVTPEQDATSVFRNYQAPEQRWEIWAFFKLLMAQFNDIEFTNVIREAVIERCRRDEKRNSVVLGKKQRFHSWGGKRSSFGGFTQDGAEDHSGAAFLI